MLLNQCDLSLVEGILGFPLNRKAVNTHDITKKQGNYKVLLLLDKKASSNQHDFHLCNDKFVKD